MTSEATTLCSKCNAPITTKYCPHCGKKAQSDRFNLKYLIVKFFHSFDLDTGFFATLKHLLVNPGKRVREYVMGERAGFSNPLKLFLIVGAVATWMTFQYDVFTINDNSNQLPLQLEDIDGFFNYSTKYFSFFTLTAIPFFSIFSWSLFLQSKFNYIENLVLNVYVAVGQFLILIIFIPLLVSQRAAWSINLYAVSNLCYNVWALIYFFQVRNWKSLSLTCVAVIVPQITVFFYNYFLYRLAPSSLWAYLDDILG